MGAEGVPGPWRCGWLSEWMRGEVSGGRARDLTPSSVGGDLCGPDVQMCHQLFTEVKTHAPGLAPFDA